MHRSEFLRMCSAAKCIRLLKHTMNARISASDLLAKTDARFRLMKLVEKLGCSMTDISLDGGKTVDVKAFLKLMRKRGYVVSEPSMMPVSAERKVYGVLIFHYTWQSCLLLALPKQGE